MSAVVYSIAEIFGKLTEKSKERFPAEETINLISVMFGDFRTNSLVTSEKVFL
jgi:hypothetical protein